MKLLARNLARSITDVKLQEIFELYGTVQSCTIVLDKETGGSKGFGFIEMPKVGEAKAAAKNLNGKEIEGQSIRVKRAEKKLESKTNVIVEAKLQEKVEVTMRRNPWKK